MTSALTAQKAFLNNSENRNRRGDIHEVIIRYQETLSYALSKVNYSMGENICMLPSDMNPRTVGYNNKLLVSDGTFSLGKNDEVNTFELEENKS